MVIDYSIGAENCYTNSERLQTSARILLKNEDGTESFALFLFYIAYEEIVKAIFCLFLHKKWITKEYADPIFKHHEKKIFFYDEFFRSFQLKERRGYLGGKKLGDVPLADFQKIHASAISKHRKKTKDFLYVGLDGNDWKSPLYSIPNLEQETKEIMIKITAMTTIYLGLKEGIENQASHIDNFRFSEKDDGSFSIQYDSI